MRKDKIKNENIRDKVGVVAIEDKMRKNDAIMRQARGKKDREKLRNTWIETLRRLGVLNVTEVLAKNRARFRIQRPISLSEIKFCCCFYS